MTTKWSYNAVSRRRSLEDAPYTPSRAAQREMYGPRQINASAPQAANDTMRGSGVGVMGGRTDDAAWDAFFGKRPSLAPTGPTDVRAMAELGQGSSLFDPKIPPTRMQTPTSMFTSAIAENERWFSQNGMSIPSAAPRRFGDRFTSRFGSGSVSSIGDFRSKLTRSGELIGTSAVSQGSRAEQATAMANEFMGRFGTGFNARNLDRHRKLAFLGIDSDLDFDF